MRDQRSCDLQRLDLCHLIGEAIFREFELVATLQIEPELRLHLP